MASVEFTYDNIMECLCGACPVQAHSECVAEKTANYGSIMTPGTNSMPPREEVALAYCATGTAACDDLDFSQRCACPSCPVYAESQLGKMKYCERGRAADIG